MAVFDIATLRAKSASELEAILAEERARLAGLRFQMSTNELKNVHELRNTRRTIARVLTVLHDLRATPAAHGTPRV